MFKNNNNTTSNEVIHFDVELCGDHYDIAWDIDHDDWNHFAFSIYTLEGGTYSLIQEETTTSDHGHAHSTKINPSNDTLILISLISDGGDLIEVNPSEIDVHLINIIGDLDIGYGNDLHNYEHIKSSTLSPNSSNLVIPGVIVGVSLITLPFLIILSSKLFKKWKIKKAEKNG